MEKKEENDNNKKDEDKSSNSNNTDDNKKETKKGGGIKFFQLIKSKINNLTNEVDKKIANITKDKNSKTKEKEKEKENENKEATKDIKEDNKENTNEKKEGEQVENTEEKKTEEKIENPERKNLEEKNEKIEEKNNLNELKTETPLETPNDQSITLQTPSINQEEKVIDKPEEKLEEKKEEFSKEELKKLYFRFHTILIENKKYEKFIPELTTIFENLTEFLIQGDKNDPSILELFIQLNFLLDILTFLQKQIKEINIQIIKFFSVLMANLSEKNFNFFLINSDYINQYVYIETEPIDGDYLYYYISFIKALLFKIDQNTLQYFFHEDRYTFPLLSNCLRIYNHTDSMISNTVRNIFLFVLKTGNKSCINYICNLPMISYFAFISCTLRDEIKTLNKKINKGKSESSTILHERICNDIMYFQDIFGINIEKVNYILTNCLFHFLVLPTLCNSLIVTPETEKKLNTMDSSNFLGKDINNVFDFTKNLIKEISKESNNLIKECISKELALYIFNLFFKYIKNETFLNVLLSVLFLPKIHYKIMQKIKTPIKDLYNYKGDYDPKAKFRLNLEKTIIENYNPSYMRGLISNPYKIFPDLTKIEKKIEERCKTNKVENDLNMSIPYAFYMDIINDYFSRGDLKICQEYHQILSEATGIQSGLSYHDDRKSVLYLLNKNLKYIKNDFSFEKIQNKYVDNLIYINFMNEFKQCKFLYLLLMYNYLFNQILKNEFVSKELLAHIELLNPNLIHKNKMSDIAEEDDPILQVGDLLKFKEEEKIKTIKIKLITFSNLYKVMYNKDFALTEFNLYDNKILAKYFYNGQKEYNSTIVGVILKYLNRDDVLRPEIYLFLSKLINDLIIYEDNGKKFLLKLRENHISTIKTIFEKNVERIIKIINSGKLEENDLIKVYEFIFDKERKNFFGEYDNIINDFMEDCLFLLNKKAEDKNKTYSDKLILYNSLDIKDLETKIRTYFIKLIFDLYDGIYEGKIKEIQVEEIKDLTEENKTKIKEIIVNNFNKLIIKEVKEEKKE